MQIAIFPDTNTLSQQAAQYIVRLQHRRYSTACLVLSRIAARSTGHQ